MKRLNTLAVLAFTLFMSTMVSAQAQAFDVGGLSYDVTGANTVEVTGRALTNSDTVIVIPSSVLDSGTTYSVTTIGAFAFDTNALTSVTIPDSVTTIGVSAFESNALTSVTFLGDFGTFNLSMFARNDSLETICTVEGASGWPQTFTPNTGPSGSVTTTTCTPATPSAPTATAGNAQASVTWTKPDDGGSTITGYAVTSSPGDQTCTTSDADALTCDVTGLTNGTAYTFTVTATNAVGTSAASFTSNSVTPAAPATPATPVPALPLFGLLTLGGLLGLFGLRKLKQ